MIFFLWFFFMVFDKARSGSLKMKRSGSTTLLSHDLHEKILPRFPNFIVFILGFKKKLFYDATSKFKHVFISAAVTYNHFVLKSFNLSSPWVVTWSFFMFLRFLCFFFFLSFCKSTLFMNSLSLFRFQSSLLWCFFVCFSYKCVLYITYKLFHTMHNFFNIYLYLCMCRIGIHTICPRSLGPFYLKLNL